MKNKWIIGTSLAALSLLVVAGTAEAQRGRRGGGTSFGISTPYFSGYYGRGGGWDRGYGYRGYGYGYPYGYGYGYRPGVYVNIGTPGYYDYGYGSYSYPSDGYYGYSVDSGAQPSIASQSFYGPSLDQDKALVHIRLPDPQGQVWIENVATDQRGLDRLFLSPPLEAGKRYVYTIKANWMENGQQMNQEKKVDIQAGQQALVAFGNEQRGGAQPLPAPAAPDARRSSYDLEERPLRDAADVRAAPGGHVMSGKIVEARDGRIIMTDMQGGNRHSHRLADNAQIVIDGKQAKLEDLKPGVEVRVTALAGDHNMASKIEVGAKATAPKSADVPKKEGDAPPPPP